MRASFITAALTTVLTLAASFTARADALDGFFSRFVAKQRLPGAVLLVSGPEGRRVLATGTADRRSNAPVTADTRFYIASVTKTMVAVMALQQAEEGLYRLDAPAGRLADDLPVANRIANLDQATVKQLLNHTSGMAEYLNEDFDKAATADPKRLWTAQAALAYAADRQPRFPVGGKYKYTNTNYVLLGHIVGRADRGDLAGSFQRRIFQRAGMTASTVGADAADPTLAHGYSLDGDRWKDVSLPSWNAPLGDGAVVTTAGDLERFVFAAFRDGALLSDRALESMKTPSPKNKTYGLGLMLYEDDNGRSHHHNGSVDGFNAQFAYYPERRTAFVFLTNGDGDPDDSVADTAVGKAAEIVFGGGKIDWKKTDAATSAPAVSAPAAAASAVPAPSPAVAPAASADGKRERKCVRKINAAYDGGEEPSPIRGRTKAEAWCGCFVRESTEDPDDFESFLADRRGRAIEKKCNRYADWGD